MREQNRGRIRSKDREMQRSGQQMRRKNQNTAINTRGVKEESWEKKRKEYTEHGRKLIKKIRKVTGAYSITRLEYKMLHLKSLFSVCLSTEQNMYLPKPLTDKQHQEHWHCVGVPAQHQQPVGLQMLPAPLFPFLSLLLSHCLFLSFPFNWITCHVCCLP